MMEDGLGHGCEFVSLHRDSSSQPWGFRMMGGRDRGCCLYIAKVKPRSLSDRYGLRPGDGVVQIGHVPATHLNHDQAKAEMLRAGNDLHLLVQRGAVRVEQEPDPVPERSQVVEEETKYRGDPNPKLQSRSFRIMTESLVEELN
ncbi:PDZ and LIM domain protein 7-like isoform X2 [Babylonia areolata]